MWICELICVLNVCVLIFLFVNVNTLSNKINLFKKIFFFKFGNTCYVNSVLQALYFCKPFREKLIQYKLDQKSLKHNEENLLNCLAELFNSISNMKKKKGIMQPKKFIQRLKKDNCK